MKRPLTVILSFIFAGLVVLSGLSGAGPLLGTKKPFYESVFCKFYLCDLSERKPLTSSVETFEYAVTRNQTDDLSGIKSVWVIRTNGLLTGGGMSTGVQDSFFQAGANAFTQRFIESLTDIRVSDADLNQLQNLADTALRDANKTGNPVKEVSLPVGAPTQKLFLHLRLYPRGSYVDAQFRVSI